MNAMTPHPIMPILTVSLGAGKPEPATQWRGTIIGMAKAVETAAPRNSLRVGCADCLDMVVLPYGVNGEVSLGSIFYGSLLRGVVYSNREEVGRLLTARTNIENQSNMV